MARLCIRIGPKAQAHYVDGFPFLPGLYFHKPPKKPKGGTEYTITHIKSGLAILPNIDERHLELCRMILGRVDWDKGAEHIYKDTTYDIVIKEALAVTTTRDASKKQEKRIAKELDGKTQAGSGSVWGYRRDVVTPELLIEAKTTTTGKYALSIKDLKHLKFQAYSEGKIPAYVIEFAMKGEVAVVPFQDLGEDFLEEFTSTRTIPSKTKSPKILTISLEMAADVFNNVGVRFIVGTDEYLLMSYENFLTFAKRGI